ncbi:MAG: C10 family peptidase [Paludibacter sp.]|nr:C10 family peptidase [Paludibacter sp.]
MKSLTITSLLLLSITFGTYAKTISFDEATLIAQKFLQQSSTVSKKAPFDANTLKRVNSFSIAEKYHLKNADQFFHIFNIAENNGFIIVSADDRAKAILGYSDSGSFDIANLPENFINWLSVYENEIKYLISQPENTSLKSAVASENKQSAALYATSIPPLLRNIKWNQFAPYNLLCPSIDEAKNKAATGCAATAMAQVMKYYNWPVSGTGSNSYTTTTLKIPLSVNFSRTKYDWTNMTDTYNASSTEIQKNAVATLMYHCGVAVNMDYNKSSSATTTDVGKALIKNFDYDKNLQIYMRSYYTKAEWEYFLKTELNVGRPVLYNGMTSKIGHIFVCDGYDSNGLYHFNWGWSGIADGYFELSALNPNETGIGGGNADGYNVDQYIVKGIRKPTTFTTPTYIIHTDQPFTSSVDSFLRKGSFDIYAKSVYNRGLNTFSGNIALGLYNENNLVQILKNYLFTDLKSFFGWTTYDFSSVTIPASVSNGNYRIYLIYKSSSESNWTKMRGKTGTPDYLSVNITSTYIKLSTPTDVLPKLTLNSLNKIGNLYQNKTGRFAANITNTGGEYISKLAIYLQSTTKPEVFQYVAIDPVVIATGETKELLFNDTITLAPGLYNASILYDRSNNPVNITSWSQLGNTVAVSVQPEPTGTPNLALKGLISFPDPQNILKSHATLNATITNTGNYFENKLIAFIFPLSTGSSIGYIGRQTAILDQNETKVVSFKGSISLEPADYRIGVYYLNSTKTWTRVTPNDFSLITFNLKEDTTTLNMLITDEGILYPNPAIDVINFRSEMKINRIRIIDLQGKEIKRIIPENQGTVTISVGDLHNGIYLLYSETENNSKVYKFIKKSKL